MKKVMLFDAEVRVKGNRFDFPQTTAKSVKQIHRFQTGHHVRLVQSLKKYRGAYEGMVAVRANGSFDLSTTQGQKISAPHTCFCFTELDT